MKRGQPNVADLRIAHRRKLVTHNVLIGNNEVFRNERAHTNIAHRKIAPRHVNKILEDRQGDAFGHVHNRAPRRVPPAANLFGPESIHSGMNLPANPVDTQAHLRGNIVLDPSQDLLNQIQSGLVF